MKFEAFKEDVTKHLAPMIRAQGQRTTDGHRALNARESKHIAEMIVDSQAEHLAHRWYREGATPRFVAEQIAYHRSQGTGY